MDDIYVAIPWSRRSRRARKIIESVLKALEELGYKPERLPRRCVQFSDRDMRYECVCCWVDEPAVIFELKGGAVAYRLNT